MAKNANSKTKEIAKRVLAYKAFPDGAQAIAYLAGEGDFADRNAYPLPALVLLDIDMPKQTGLEVLEWTRQQPQFKSLPVLILTSSSRDEDRHKARELGANDYLLKPCDPLKLADIVKSLHDRWLPQPAITRKPKKNRAHVRA